MGVISNLLSGGAANIVKSVGDIADKYIRTKEEKDQFNLEVQKEIFSQSMQQQSMILENLKVAAADRDSARKLFAVNSSMQKILGYCAVFGFFVYAMFITYPHRARVFREAVQAIAREAGVDLEEGV